MATSSNAAKKRKMDNGYDAYMNKRYTITMSERLGMFHFSSYRASQEDPFDAIKTPKMAKELKSTQRCCGLGLVSASLSALQISRSGRNDSLSLQ
jgi:hypothetical protein